jgi:nucleoside-diphosphate-sugar epimerase
MTKQRIFITGASGCVGHYICENLIQNTDHDLYLLVRNQQKLTFDYEARPGVTIIEGNMKTIDQLSDILKTMDQAILTATAWGDPQETFDTNVLKTVRLMELLDPDYCKQVIYFSTASVLGRDNQVLKQAGEIGTDYVRTKYDCLSRLSKLAIYPKITTVFPTLVLGGDDKKPLSHITGGIRELIKYLGLIKFFSIDGGFHFIHGKDIAEVIRYLITNIPTDTDNRQLVLGSKPYTINQAIAEICQYLNKKIYFRIPLSFLLAEFFIKVFNIKLAAWDRFCMEYRHFTYQKYVNPSTLGLSSYCSNMADVLRASGL